jgi:hypothetical protein
MTNLTRTSRLLLATLVVLSAADAAAQSRGVQLTPDGRRLLVSKDVGAERWAITRNEDGSVTGNVYRPAGAPAFLYCVAEGGEELECFGADACADDRGGGSAIQSTPDGLRVLVQKDVGAERWAISQNLDDGTLTGNVYRPTGAPAFLFCEPTGPPNTYACEGANRCPRPPCGESFTPIGEVVLPADFFAPPDPCTPTVARIGVVSVPEEFFTPRPTVTFTVDASAAIQGFQIEVDFPLAKGAFSGTAEAVACTTSAPGILTKNNTGSALILSVANIDPLPLPLDVSCTFVENEGQELLATDPSVRVIEVTQDNAVGDPTVLSVAIGVD